jgi:erythromycin esterase
MNITRLLTLYLLFSATCLLLAQPNPEKDKSPLYKELSDTLLGQPVTALNLNDFTQFRKQVQPLIRQMATKRVVGMGEGTHGTSEFYKIRFWMTKILVEEYGFNNVVFENDFADSYQLNKRLLDNQNNLDDLMKRYLLAIWQNQEVKELLQWIKERNKSKPQSTIFGGIDCMFIGNDALILRDISKRSRSSKADSLSNKLAQLGSDIDSAWYKQSMDSVTSLKMVEAYRVVKGLEQALASSSLSVQDQELANRFTENVRMELIVPYEAIVNQRTAGDRDSSMALGATRFLRRPTDKLIIWAHNAHVGRKVVFGGEVGGAGGKIDKLLRGQYFVLGTGTATGTYASTTDQFITHISAMRSTPIKSPPDSLWEGRLSRVAAPVFYIDLTKFKPTQTKFTYRLIGYDPNTGKRSHDKSHPISDLYDAYFFIRETKAPAQLK